MTSVTYTATRKITTEHTRTELIQNGDMGSSTGWILGANWAISGGLLTHTPGSTAGAGQNITFVVGYKYIVAYQVTGRTAGSITVTTAGHADTSRSADGYYSYTATASSNNFDITPSSDFNGSIDNVSVVLTSVWSMDVSIVDIPQTTVVNKNTQFALDSKTNDTIFHSYAEEFVLSTFWIDYPDLTTKYWGEFIYSIIGGETYTLDLRGTVASPNTPQSAIMIGNPNWEFRHPDRHKISWRTRIVS